MGQLKNQPRRNNCHRQIRSRRNRILGGLLAGCAVLASNSIAYAQLSPSAVKRPVASGSTENIPPTYKGPSSAVAAIVKDKVITTFDVEQRMKLMIVSSGGRVTHEMLGQLQTQALRDLVEEKLKSLEGQKWEMKVDDAEVVSELQRVAASGGVTVKQLEQAFAADGITLQSLSDQIRVGILWPRLVQARYQSRVRVNDDEVEQTYERMRDDASKEQFLVSEICIPVPNSSEAERYYQGALQLLEQMRRGVPFAVVAQQFSACTSAASGGDIGWVRAGELAPEIDAALKELPAGSVTNPIPSDGAFMLMAIRDKRDAVVKGEETFTFAYAGAPLSKGRNAARQALEKLPAAEACTESSLRQDLGKDVGIALLENMTLDAIDPRFRDAVEDLDRGELGPIIEADDALHVVYVCDKDEGLGLPSRDAIKDRIYGRQLTRISQQYLRDVERDSLVDIRLRTSRQN